VLPDLLSACLRGLSFVAMMQAAGAMLFLARFGAALGPSRRSIERRGSMAAVAALVLVLVQFSLEAARMAGSFAGIFDAELQLFALSTPSASVLALRVIGLLLVLVGIKRSLTTAVLVGLTGVLLVAASFALTGHTASHVGRWLLAPLLVVHVLIVSFWFGSLRPLLHIVEGEPARRAAELAARFSRIAGILVPIILIAGLVIAVRLLSGVQSLRTAYGSILVAKVLAFAALMALAAFNRWRWAPALASGDHRARRSFRAAVMTEWTIIVLVLLSTAFLTTFWSPS
jgi:putative copper export protein